MKALREAKAEIDLVRMVRGKSMADWSRAERALIALVEEIEAAPVGEAIAHANRDGEWAEIDGLGHDDLDALDGRRVRVLATGEQP